VVSSLYIPERWQQDGEPRLVCCTGGVPSDSGEHMATKGGLMLYTLGYSGWTPQAIQAEAQARHAVVCDIRYSPASRHPPWRKCQLAQLLGARYQQVQALGSATTKIGGRSSSSITRRASR
jgi:hypothetical protein